ncbi:double-stranded RNA-specific editase 1-like [Lampetra planeri]
MHLQLNLDDVRVKRGAHRALALLPARGAPPAFWHARSHEQQRQEEDNMSSGSVKENCLLSDSDDSQEAATAPVQGLSPSASGPEVGGLRGPAGGGLKRALEEENAGRAAPRFRPKRRRRAGGLSLMALPKNALMQLNELRPGLQYRVVSQTGPVHAPRFTLAVDVNGDTFVGAGPTKREAKARAAERALRSFVQFPDAWEAHRAMGRAASALPANADFARDEQGEHEMRFDVADFASEPGVARTHSGGGAAPSEDPQALESYQPPGGPPLGAVALFDAFSQVRNNPVWALGALHPDAAFGDIAGPPGVFGAAGPTTAEGGSPRVVVQVTVGGCSFRGAARSKRVARSRAAQAALRALYGIGAAFRPARPPTVGSPQGLGENHAVLSQGLADRVARLVLDKFAELAGGRGDGGGGDGGAAARGGVAAALLERRKVLAGMVLTRGLCVKRARVVCLATGTKCLHGEFMSVAGLALNDCHAEVVCRRALLRYLYSQLQLLSSPVASERDSSVVEARAGGGGYRLRPGWRLHLYVSTAPCGDARLFSTQEKEVGADRHPRRRARGQLRTKLECGEGTVPARRCLEPQTWDGVLQGEPLLAMACSDKIARWNVLGVQGALLSRLLEPIYLHGLVLGSLYRPQHLWRAVCARVRGVTHLPGPYRLNAPRLACSSDPDVRRPGKAPVCCLNWSAGEPGLEAVSGATGKADGGQPSRLCKQALFACWAQLHPKLNVRVAPSAYRGHPEATPPGTYAEAKQAARDYQAAKQQLFRGLRRAGLGDWVKKPMEQDQFCLQMP